MRFIPGKPLESEMIPSKQIREIFWAWALMKSVKLKYFEFSFHEHDTSVHPCVVDILLYLFLNCIF